MATDTTCFHVAIIGPSDTAQEVAAANSAIFKLSSELSKQGITLASHHWSQLPPGLGEPQGYIDRNLAWADVDYVIGFMRGRLGTPVSDAESGTVHEVEIVTNHHSKTGSPELLFYFQSQATENSPEVAKFAAGLRQNALTASYSTPLELETLIADHLRQKVLKANAPPSMGLPHTIGPLPANRRLTVEMMISSQMPPDEVPMPTIIVFKNGLGAEYIFDAREATNMQAFCNWVSKSMGYDSSGGKTLSQYLVEKNLSNVQAMTTSNEPVVAQMWLGHIFLFVHKKFGQAMLKLVLAKPLITTVDKDKWLPILKARKLILAPKHIRINQKGEKEYQL